MSAFSPYPQRYLSLGFDGRNPHKCTSSTLAGAIKALRQQSGIVATAAPEAARSMLRWWAIETGAPSGIWSILPDGRWLSLDPEEAQDAVRSDEALAAYEAAIMEPTEGFHALTYRMRRIDPDGEEIIKDYPTVRSALTAFAEAIGFPFPVGPNFTWALMRVDIDNKEVSLCARLSDSIAAVPVPLKRAEEALVSNHAELTLASELRSEVIQESNFSLPGA